MSGGGTEEKKETGAGVPMDGGAATVPAAAPSVSAHYASQAKKREGNPFASRIAAHAGCTKKLWRARYLALREVRLLRGLRFCVGGLMLHCCFHSISGSDRVCWFVSFCLGGK